MILLFRGTKLGHMQVKEGTKTSLPRKHRGTQRIRGSPGYAFATSSGVGSIQAELNGYEYLS